MRVAYRATRYRVFPGHAQAPIDLRIDQASAAMDAWLRARGARSGTLISACNPRSVALPPAENARRTRDFEALLRRQFRRWRHATGLPDAADWSPEAGFFILDLPWAQALRLANQFEQYALVQHRLGRVSELVFTPLYPGVQAQA